MPQQHERLLQAGVQVHLAQPLVGGVGQRADPGDDPGEVLGTRGELLQEVAHLALAQEPLHLGRPLLRPASR